MRFFRLLYVSSLCLVLVFGTVACHRKGIIPCPKQTSKRNRVKVHGKGAQGLEAIRVPRDKNGHVKKGLL